MLHSCARRLLIAIALFAVVSTAFAADPKQSFSSTTLGDLITAIHTRADALQNSSGMKFSYRDFIRDYKLPQDTVSYHDYVLARLFYEATRDAGFWNLHWEITNQPPNSDQVWRQWRQLKVVSPAKPSATAECDELSALYAFFVLRSGVHGIGLYWPYPNHTVAVWVLHPPGGTPVRVVVPTTQIFLSESDDFGTHKFNPWTQKQIFEYTRRDAPDSYVLPPSLYNFFLQQIDKYAGATDITLQRIRYLREAVLRNNESQEDAARDALRLRSSSLPQEDQAAFQHFAEDLRSSR